MSHLAVQKRDGILVWVEDLVSLQVAAGNCIHLPSDYLNLHAAMFATGRHVHQLL